MPYKDKSQAKKFAKFLLRNIHRGVLVCVARPPVGSEGEPAVPISVDLALEETLGLETQADTVSIVLAKDQRQESDQ